jgi:hypothetical protein
MGWSESRQITQSGGNVFQPEMKVGPDGTVHVVWSDNRDGNREIYYLRLDSTGSILVPETRITYDAALSRRPDLAIDADGFIHVVWEDNRDGNDEIYHARLDAGGTVLVADRRLTNNPGRSKSPRIAFDAERSMHLVWQDLRGTGWLLYHRKFSVSGLPLGPEIRLTDEPFDAVEPDLAIDSQMGVHLVWSDTRVGHNQVVYAKITDDLAIDGSPVTDGLNVSFSPRIDVGPDDSIHIVWRDYRDRNSEVYYQKQDRNGNVLANDVRLTVDWPASLDTSVLGDHTGSADIIWRDNADGNPELRHARVDRDGFVIVDLERITYDSAESELPVIDRGPDGLVHLVWRDFRPQDGFAELFHKVRDLSVATRRGNVNAKSGPIANVLTVNGSIGDPDTRVVYLTPTTPGTVAVASPPSMPQGTRFVLYLYDTVGNSADVRNLGSGIGDLSLSNPLGGPGIQPITILNGLQHNRLLGAPTQVPRRTPTAALRFPQGLGVTGRVTIQGLILDSRAINGILSTTNAVILDVQ